MGNFSAESQARSIRRVEKVCIDCGRDYTTSYNAQRTSRRCPKCQVVYNYESQVDKRRRARAFKERALDKARFFELLNDVDGSWQENGKPRLAWVDVVLLVKSGYVAAGSMFKDTRCGKVYLVVNNGDNLGLVEKEVCDGGVE